MLAERVQEWTREWREQGLEDGRKEGLEKGRKEGEALLLERLLEQKFGPLSEENRKRVREADAETLLEWGVRVLSASHLADVFA